MKTVALISGGKDSCFNMMCCIAEGHNVVALANLRPPEPEEGEMDSYMYQTVGHDAIDLYAEATGLPLFTHVIEGASLETEKDYAPREGDEVEDLYRLLQKVKQNIDVEAVSVGAILSDYQRIRVENVCTRLGLKVLSFLWRRDQEELLMEMISCGVKAKIIKVAAMGLTPNEHLMLDLEEILPHMLAMRDKYGLNVCGEGGEYETFVYDCPVFKKKIKIGETETVIHSDDAFAPVGYIKFKECTLEDKEGWDDSIPVRDKILELPIATSAKWVEEQISNETTLHGQAGGGDTWGGGVVMCVPNMKITGEEEVIVRSDGKFFYIAGVIAPLSEDGDVGKATNRAIHTLREIMNHQGLKSADICSVSLYVGDMSNFAAINQVYKIFFTSNPPVRLCIQANLPRNIALQIDCQGKISSPEQKESDCRHMHVQALSHWAPANIGPYSQAVLAGHKLYLAGIVPLVPASLEVVPGGIAVQCSVSLAHVQAILTAMHDTCTLGCCPLVNCYLTNQEYVDTAKKEWIKALSAVESDFEKSPMSPMVQYCVVPALPRGCLVEWHMYAWPFLDDDISIREISLKKDYDNYTIFSHARSSKEKGDLFSCIITVEAPASGDYRRYDSSLMVTHLLDEFVKLCEEHKSAALTPLAKVFFSPNIFEYTVLQKCFSEAVSNIRSIGSVHPPIVSLVAVNNLESRNQLLAWCQ